MRWLYTTASTGMLLLALASCGHPQPAVGFGGPPPPSPSSLPPSSLSPTPLPPTPQPGQQGTAVPDSEVDSSKLPPGYPHTVLMQDGGTVLVVSVAQGGCTKDQAEVADQSPQQVTVAVVNVTPQHSPGMCSQLLRYVPQVVRLAAPLDQRKIVLEVRSTSIPNSGPATG